MDYADVLRFLKKSDAEIHSVCRCGSRVYGTAGPRSDEDFFVILAGREARRDLLFRGGANFVVHSLPIFREALAEQSVFALECLFAPAEHRLKAGPMPPYTVDREKLAASAGARSASDFKKAERTFEGEPLAAKKKLFHALRVPMFAKQIAARGRIVDFGEARPLWAEIAARPEEGWEPYAISYGPLRERLVAEIAPRGKRR